MTHWESVCGFTPSAGDAAAPVWPFTQTVRRSCSISRPQPEQCGVTTPPRPKAVCVPTEESAEQQCPQTYCHARYGGDRLTAVAFVAAASAFAVYGMVAAVQRATT